jgi:hypothetical protein
MQLTCFILDAVKSCATVERVWGESMERRRSAEQEEPARARSYVGRALPGPEYRLKGSLAKARVRDQERIAALKRSGQDDASKGSPSS